MSAIFVTYKRYTHHSHTQAHETNRTATTTWVCSERPIVRLRPHSQSPYSPNRRVTYTLGRAIEAALTNAIERPDNPLRFEVGPFKEYRTLMLVTDGTHLLDAAAASTTKRTGSYDTM